MTIASDEPQMAYRSISAEELRTATYGFDRPFQLHLADNQVFYADKVVRLVPGRRMVAFGTWLGKSAVVKIFLDASQSKRHRESELAGIELLHYNNIPTPLLYHQGQSQTGRLHVLIFERIHHASNLYDMWQHKNHLDEVMPALKAVVVEIATQHVLGIMQHDLHLKNFLVGEKAIYSLDGSQIEKLPYLIPKKSSMKHFALLLSQLSVASEALQESLFHHYAKQRGWLLKEEDFHELTYLVKQWNKERSCRYEKKIFRDSTQFSRLRRRGKRGMYDRDYASANFMHFLKNPESAFTDRETVILKAGRSSTVVKIILDDRELVVKRYNMKSKWHRLRRMLRKTRAFQSWRLAQKLRLFGIATAKPVAFIENYLLLFHGTSYFVTEYVSSMHAGHYFAKSHTSEKVATMVERISDLLLRLKKMDMTHGDLKMTNIVIDENEKPMFVDLDGAKEHTSLKRFRQVWASDILRFLQNFQREPLLEAQFFLALSVHNKNSDRSPFETAQRARSSILSSSKDSGRTASS